MLSKATEYPIPDDKTISFIYEAERDRLKRKKFKVGELYTIKLFFNLNKKKLIYIFIEETDDGENKVFYCPERNQYFTYNYDNNWTVEIEEYE